MRRRWQRGRGGARRSATVEMASLIDMVFILLIFFIVTTSFIKESGVLIERPESPQARAIVERPVPVAIHITGTVHVGGRVIRADDAAEIARVLGETGSRRIVIQADRNVPTWLLLKVHAACRQAGAERVDISAKRASP